MLLIIILVQILHENKTCSYYNCDYMDGFGLGRVKYGLQLQTPLYYFKRHYHELKLEVPRKGRAMTASVYLRSTISHITRRIGGKSSFCRK
jgi:hypothetical protein